MLEAEDDENVECEGTYLKAGDGEGERGQSAEARDCASKDLCCHQKR